MKKDKKDLLEFWIQKADEDYSVANLLKLRKKYGVIACFHLQQSTEKYLKAYLIFFDLEPPKTHNLEDLLDLVITKDNTLKQFEEKIAELTPFAISGRYPEFDEIDMTEWNQLSIIARDIRKEIRSKLKKALLNNLS